MTRDETGYVRFRCRWKPAPPLAGPEVDALLAWRGRLHALGLIGAYPDGIGFGNLSHRIFDTDDFLVSGTRTGHLATLGPEHLTRVTGFALAGNSLDCVGPVQASSESLSHAAVYRADPAARAAIHVHHLGMWERLLPQGPATDPAAAAGTSEMALAILELLRDPGARRRGLFVMGGHVEGLMAFGATLDEAGERILKACREVHP